MRLPWSREKIPEHIRDAVDLTLGERVRAAVESEEDVQEESEEDDSDE